MEPFSNFLNKGFFSFYKMLSYVFPKEGSPEPTFIHNKWIRRMTYLNPLLAILLMVWIFYWGYFLVAFVGVYEKIGIVFFTLSLILLIISIIPTLFLFSCALLLKVKKRSPAIPLILSLLWPLKSFCVLSCVCLLGFFFTPNDMLYNKTTKTNSVKKPSLKTQPDNATLEKFRLK